MLSSRRATSACACMWMCGLHMCSLHCASMPTPTPRTLRRCPWPSGERRLAAAARYWPEPRPPPRECAWRARTSGSRGSPADGAEAVQRRCGGSAEAVRRRGGGGAEAVRRRCGGGAEAVPRAHLAEVGLDIRNALHGDLLGEPRCRGAIGEVHILCMQRAWRGRRCRGRVEGRAEGGAEGAERV